MKLKKIIIYSIDILKTKVIEGNYFKYCSVRFENYIRYLLNLKLKKKKDFWMIIKNNVGKFKINISNDSIDKSTEIFEFYLHSWIPKNKHGIFIDVGANIGFYSFFAVNKRNFSKVYSFEANPKTFQLLKENILLNKLKNHIFPVNVALGSNFKNLLLEQKEVHTGGSQIIQNKKKENVIKVNQIPFDIFICNKKIKINDIDFIKIDVEGFEFEVLRGMEKTLKKVKKGTLIQIEIWKKSTKSQKTKNLLEKLNFKRINSLSENFLYIKI